MTLIGVRFQKKLPLCSGMIDAEDVDEVLLVCRKRPASTGQAFLMTLR